MKKESILIILWIYFLKLLARVVSIRYVYEVKLNEISGCPTYPMFNLVPMTEKDLSDIYSTYKNEMSYSRFIDLMSLLRNEHTILYIAKDNKNNVCGYCAAEFEREVHKNIFSKIKELDIKRYSYTSRDYTFKIFRGLGIHTFMILTRIKLLKDLGYDRAITRVAVQNLVSNHNYYKCGYKVKLIEFHFHFFNRFKNTKYLFIKSWQNVPFGERV